MKYYLNINLYGTTSIVKRTRWAGACRSNGEVRNAYAGSEQKPPGKWLLGRQ